MNKSLMVGLTEKDMQAVVNSYEVKDLYYPTLMPLKQTYSLTIKALEEQVGLRIAGDLVARGASIDSKTREAIARIQGDIPKIAIKRIKDENELNEYDIMVAMTSGDPDLRALIDAWAEDTQFCWNGVANRLEWMALQSISKGYVKLTNENNNNIITEYNLDYQIASDQKSGYKQDKWSNTSTAKPISKDFKEIVESAKAKGYNLKHVFMNLDTFSKMVQTDEVIKMSASFAQNALKIAYTPSQQAVQQAMDSQAYLRGLKLHIIDQDITIENTNGTRTTGNPFEDDVCMFSESAVLGNTYWKKPADMNLQNTGAMMVMNGHTCIKKFSEDEPICEVTMGIANAIPVWTSSSRSFLMDVENTSFNK